MTKPLIILDQDGVVDDFVGGACKAHGRPNPYFSGENTGVFEMIKAWGITKEQFWAPIDAMGKAFWLGLEKTPEADAIVERALAVAGPGRVIFLTAPSDDPGCVPGKRERSERNYPGIPVVFAGAKDKHYLAGPGRYLFDDKDSNVVEFSKAGGIGVTVPRPWNKLHGRNCLDHVTYAFNSIEQAAALQPVPDGARGTLHGGAVAPAPSPRGQVVVQRTANGITETYRPAARGYRRGMASDDICLMSCSGCGAVHSSAKPHYCHPDASGPLC